MLDTEVGVDHRTPEDVARSYVQAKGLAVPAPTPAPAPGPGPGPGTGPGTKGSVTVGSAAFAENETLAYIYRDVLASAGYTVAAKLDLGSREKYEPDLEAGTVDILPEYVGNYLTFLDPKLVNVPLSGAVSMLRAQLEPRGLTVLDPSSASDADAIVVTATTASKYHLTKISDLGQSYTG